MGSLYTLVGLAVAGIIFIVPKVGWGGWGGGAHAVICRLGAWLARCSMGDGKITRQACRGTAKFTVPWLCCQSVSLHVLRGLNGCAVGCTVSQVKDAQARRYAAYGLLALAFLAFRSVTANHLWKTGMRTHWYWP